MKHTHLIILFLFALLPFRMDAASHHDEADSLLLLGQQYNEDNRYMDALDVLTQAVQRAEASQNNSVYLRSLLTIANIHSLFEDNELAIHYYDLCYNKAQNLGDQLVMNHAAYNKLISLCTLGDYEAALTWHQKIGIIEMDDPQKTRFYDFIQQGQLAKAKQDYHAAIYYFHEAMLFAQSHEMGVLYYVPQMGQIGTMEERLGNPDKALEWYQMCQEEAQQHGLMATLVTSYERLASLHRKLHNDSASMRYQRLYVQLSDSLFSEREFKDKRSRIADYETRSNLLKIDSLNDRNRSLLWVIAIIAVMLLALIVLIIYVVRQNRHLVDTQRLLIDKHNELNQQLEIQSRMSEEYFSKVGQPAASVQPAADEDADQLSADAAEPDVDAEEPADASAPLLSKQQTDHLLMAIAQVMEDASLISDPDFSLQKLAILVNSNTKYVSWAINATYGKNFKTYLNEYRVREASHLLVDPDKMGHLTIAAISEQLGYKSPTSFNQAFKRVFGMTPAAYQKLACK